MYKLNLNTDEDSIDFDFFEAEGGKFKSHENGKKYSSKIITTAVIETKPIVSSKSNQSNITPKTLQVNANAGLKKKNSMQNIINDCISSPTSSEEKRLLGNSVEDLTLFNCLAFNNDSNDKQICNADDKYFSDNSLSDSTITTVTSDFTTVSHLSSMSDSSCGSDLSTDSSTPQSHDLITSNDNIRSISTNTEDLDMESNEGVDCFSPEVCPPVGYLPEVNSPEGCSPEVLINESDHSIESINFKDEYNENFDDYEEEGNNSNTDEDTQEIHKTDSEKLNTNIERGNMNGIGNSNGNQEFGYNRSYGSLSRKESVSTIGDRLGDISLASQSSSSNSNIAKPHYCKMQNKFRSKKKELNLTFSREELIKIERDNTILLKKIMSYSKPRSVSLNHVFSHKKTSAAINRARQQKKIEQDNYILYSKINAMSRMKKVF